MSKAEVRRRAYAAGFFDGEGSVFMKAHHNQLVVSITQKDPTILLMLQAWIGCGRIVDTKNSHRLDFTNKADVFTLITYIYPYVLDPTKRYKLRCARKIILGKLEWRERFYASL